jgi:hypothetical protein
MTVKGRTVALVALLTALFIAGIWLTGQPVSDDTLALRRFLSENGSDVRASDGPPSGSGSFVLMSDVRTPPQFAPILRWVEDGGRLIITDPDSPALASLGVGRGDSLGGIGTVPLAPGCPVREAVGIDEIEADARDLTLHASSPDAVACFVRPGGAYAIFINRGRGRVAIFGGNSFIINELLDHADNATLARRVFGDGAVVFGSPAPSSGESPGLWALLPDPAQLVLIEVGIGVVLFAVSRARRLGKPVIEEPIAPIQAGELVRATAGLYRRARATAFSGSLLRRSARERLSPRIGASPEASSEVMAQLVSASTRLPLDQIEHSIGGPEPTSDDELLALAADLSVLTRDVEGTIP